MEVSTDQRARVTGVWRNGVGKHSVKIAERADRGECDMTVSVAT